MSQFHMTATQSESTPSALSVVILLITTYHERLLAVWLLFQLKKKNEKKGFHPNQRGGSTDGWCVMVGGQTAPFLSMWHNEGGKRDTEKLFSNLAVQSKATDTQI